MGGLGAVRQAAPDPLPRGARPARQTERCGRAGFTFLLPTGTEPLLSARKWGAGPSAVGLVLRGRWTAGMLANHIWSFAGNSEHQNISNPFVQPFAAYTCPSSDRFPTALSNQPPVDVPDKLSGVILNFYQ